MAGLLAWAADVVGGGHDEEEDDESQFPALVFTPEQEERARWLDQRAASLRRSIQDLRRRIPPADISQRLPHLHAHSLASNAALAFQLNAHSTTRQQAQDREETLQEENIAYEKAILACQKRIQEKAQEASLLQRKLEEMDLAEKELRAELDRTQEAWKNNQPEPSKSSHDSRDTEKILEQLNEKKNELSTFEEMVRSLEEKWDAAQRDSLTHASPAQREKSLEKQLHSLIEQLTAKQAQAEGLIGEVKVKEEELEKLSALRRRLEFGGMEENTTRNRFGRSRTEGGYEDQATGAYRRHALIGGGRAENQQQKLILLRSAFVLYILTLHVLVFIKISV